MVARAVLCTPFLAKHRRAPIRLRSGQAVARTTNETHARSVGRAVLCTPRRAHERGALPPTARMRKRVTGYGFGATRAEGGNIGGAQDVHSELPLLQARERLT